MVAIMPRSLPPILAEVAATIVVATIVAGLGARAWDAYEVEIRPFARVVATFTPTPVPDLAKAMLEGRRIRQVMDGLGAANAFRDAGKREWAIERLREVLEIDPGNLEARAGLRELGIIAPVTVALNTPVPTPIPVLPTNTPTRR